MRESDIRLELITATDDNGAIGYQNKLPWQIPSEFKYFLRMSSKPKDPSKKCIAIMGRRSWFSLPTRPFPDCINIVLSNTLPTELTGDEVDPEHTSDLIVQDNTPSKPISDVYVARSWEHIIELLNSPEIRARRDRIWVHGGHNLYELALQSPYFYRLYQTHVHGTYPADAYFPEIDFGQLKKVTDPDAPQGLIHDNGHSYEVHVYENS
ncbi:unnamed protein product [Cyprideis torosa]|uniref:dihydrofolate reductase n=1 Tax=Cyprideis torosa TaxID=163714 RepID=A0A7R8W2C2_9CRUS|nr:unnamed protein product [Cyprideis torosa]CAG0881796.1 unnamed protein product [Cyprideis torosa]